MTKEITCYKDIAQLMLEASVFRADGIHSIYRGQGQDWPLLTGLGRIEKPAGEIATIEAELLSEFEARIRAEIPELLQRHKFSAQYTDGEDWSVLFQAQHLRLPTRLLDWSSCIETAVMFAVNCESESDNGVLWVYKTPEIFRYETMPEYLNLKLNQTKRLMVINHPFSAERKADVNIGEERRSKQNGFFTVQNIELVFTPLNEQPEVLQHLRKVIIPKEAKASLRKELAGKGKSIERLNVKEDDEIDRIIGEVKSSFGIA